MIRLCGMLGSSHEGERANAAALADKLVRSLGLTWETVLAPKALKATTPEWGPTMSADYMINICLDNMVMLTPWEREFMRSIDANGIHTTKQWNVLHRIYEKVTKR